MVSVCVSSFAGRGPYVLNVGLYKIFVQFEAFVQEAILLFATAPFVWAPPSPHCIAYTIAQDTVAPRSSFLAIHAIQYWQWQYPVKAKLNEQGLVSL